jgi:hypothetical protein
VVNGTQPIEEGCLRPLSPCWLADVKTQSTKIAWSVNSFTFPSRIRLQYGGGFSRECIGAIYIS